MKLLTLQASAVMTHNLDISNDKRDVFILWKIIEV